TAIPTIIASGTGIAQPIATSCGLMGTRHGVDGRTALRPVTRRWAIRGWMGQTPDRARSHLMESVEVAAAHRQHLLAAFQGNGSRLVIARHGADRPEAHRSPALPTGWRTAAAAVRCPAPAGPCAGGP